MSKLGAHLAGIGRSGYGSFCESKPAVIISVGDGGGLQEARQKSNGHTWTIYRDISVYTEAPNGINQTNIAGAIRLADEYYPLLKEQWTAPNNAADFYTITNEQGGNDFGSYERIIAYEKRIIELGAADGLRFAMLNLAGGSPGDIEAPGLWDVLCAPYIAWGWARGCIYSRHEYGSNSVMFPFDGNTGRAIRELEYLNNQGHYGGIVITELGVNGGYGFIGKDAWVKTRTDYDKEIMKHRDIIGACDWNAGSNEFNANMSPAFPGLSEYNLANPSEKWQPIDTPPTNPIPPPTEAPTITNPSFENGWTDKMIGGRLQQIPNGWNLQITAVGKENILGAFVTDQPECTHKLASQLPPDEQPGGSDPLILDGTTTYKMVQAVNMVCGVKLSQVITGLKENTRYKVTIPLRVHYHPPDSYDRQPPIEEDDVRIQLQANSNVRQLDTFNLIDRQWIAVEVLAQTADNETEINLSVEWANSYPNSRDLFIDDLQIEQIETGPPIDPDPPPGNDYKSVVVKLAQEHTRDDWLNIAGKAHDNYKRTQTASLDNALVMVLDGNDESYVIVVDPHLQSQQETIAEFEARSIRWQGLLLDEEAPPPNETFEYTNPPLSTPLHINQAWGANPQYYGQFGLPGHDGLDIRANIGDPVTAVAPGQVYRVELHGDAHNYGKHVRIVHQDGYKTIYAHLSNVGVTVGQNVQGGHVIGRAGSTGNSSGVHLHLAEKKEGITYTDTYGTWPYNLHDPSQHMKLDWFDSTPPVGQAVNVLPYLMGQNRRQFDLGYSTGTQTSQIWHLSPTEWLYIKGNNGEYERLWVQLHNGEEWIFRADDTSESPTRMYAHYINQGGALGAPWIPVNMVVGHEYSTDKWVQHYLKDGCVPQNSGDVVDVIKLISKPYNRTYAESGQTESVITLQWQHGEQYDFAGGNVAFRDATRNFWFMGWLEGREDLSYKKYGCFSW